MNNHYLEEKSREAMFYESIGDEVRCRLCPWECKIPENAVGVCGVRRNRGGKLYAESYGFVSSIALDPLKKKPLYHFHPNKNILSIGSYGCNFRCLFCQNYHISMEKPETERYSPEEIVNIAEHYVKNGDNIGIAYTYNEPLIGYEFVLDCAKLSRERGLLNVVVTNGCILERPFKNLLPYIDAMNIDLKGSQEFYKKIGGDHDTVKNNIKLAASYCHVEVTTLVIPNENDSCEEIEETAKFLAEINPDIPLHLSRFFPQYKYANKSPTPKETIIKLQSIANKYLRYVYTGNMH